MAEQSTLQQETFLLGGDLRINRMGYGAMRITGEGIWGPPQDKEEAKKVLKRTRELGINFIDTADSYGPHVSEELIAEALYPYADDLVIGTKGGLVRPGPGEWQVNAKPEHLKEALEGSLKRLKLDQIPLYQLHRIDPDVPAEKTFEFLQKVREEGLVKHIGLSEVSVEQIEKAQEYFPVVSVQNKFSLVERDWDEVLDYCRKKNIAFIPWNPMNAGNLDDNRELRDKLNKVAGNHNASVHQISLAWLYQLAPNILLIPGTSKLNHLEDNFKAAEIHLSEEEMKELGNK